jgi:hypothetical protein
LEDHSQGAAAFLWSCRISRRYLFPIRRHFWYFHRRQQSVARSTLRRNLETRGRSSVINCSRSSDRRAARFERTTTCFPWCRVLTRKTLFTSISPVEAEMISCLSIVISLRSFRRGALLTSITRLRADMGGTIGTDRCRIYCGQPHASYLIIMAGIRNSVIVAVLNPARNARI